MPTKPKCPNCHRPLEYLIKKENTFKEQELYPDGKIKELYGGQKNNQFTCPNCEAEVCQGNYEAEKLLNPNTIFSFTERRVIAASLKKNTAGLVINNKNPMYRTMTRLIKQIKQDLGVRWIPAEQENELSRLILTKLIPLKE